MSKKEGKKNKSTKRRGVLKSQAREMIVNIRTYFEREKLKGGPVVPLDQVIARTAAACQISESLISYLITEKKSKSDNDNIHPPDEKVRPPENLLDLCQENAIRRHIYAYYERGDYPTKRRLVASLNQAGLFCGNTSTLCFILKKLGFSWKKVLSNKKLLMESVDAVARRGRFMREILSTPVERIVWLDEACVSSECFKKQKTNEKKRVTKNASTGFRLIVLHAGSIEGFVPNAKLVFRGKMNSSDYHKEISHLTFKQWFKENLIPNLKPKRIIVMDDAPFHCIHKEKYPTIAQTKKDIITWLESKNIKFDRAMLRTELLEVVKQQKPRFPIYEIDEIAKEHGHGVLRIPPCHSHFNPNEIIWDSVINNVAEKSKTFNISEATTLTEEIVNNIGPKDWETAIKHTMEVIKTQTELDYIVEERVDNMIHALQNNSESEESDHSDEEYSDDEMDVEDDFPPFKGRSSELHHNSSPTENYSTEYKSIDVEKKQCEQESSADETMEIKEEFRDEEYNISYRRLPEYAKQNLISAKSHEKEDCLIDIEEPRMQEVIDWNIVKKEEES